MPIELNLVRSVNRRADTATVRKNLLNVVAGVSRKEPRAGVPKISVVATPGGFAATIAVPGKMPAAREYSLQTALIEAVTTRFDPPWLQADAVQAAPTESGQEPTQPEEPPARPIGEISLDFPPDAFSRIYGREAQIRRLTDAVSLGRDTGWAKRKHTLFLGPPGCGKTETMLTFARLLGEEGKAWLWFDATGTTRAGAIEMLMRAPAVPPVLFVEEIEKTQESSLRWLLGVMDERGEIRRTNYRVGNQVKAIKLCVVATCNNEQLLKGMDAGALYSRFANRVYCPEPTREVLAKILTREVSELSGTNWTDQHSRWVAKALEFGYDKLNGRDPRELINMVLCGRDRLLDGSYQKDFEETLSPWDRKMKDPKLAALS
jgi:energy-coupling factor transporter ATP-binding protein EcfA2